MEQKAWIDVKSPHFFIWKAIQDIGVMVYGMKPVITPTIMQISGLKIPAIPKNNHSSPNRGQMTVPVGRSR